MTILQQQLSQQFADWPWQFAKPLAELTYFKIGGPAEAYVELAEEQQIAQLAKWCSQQQVRLTLLGGASNVIVADEGIEGVVLRLLNEAVEIDETIQRQGQKLVVAGAGTKMPLLVRKTVDVNLTGLEYFLGVPGTLGGAVYNNAHYLSHLIGEHITRVRIVSQAGDLVWLNHGECDFSYDHSRFQKSKEVIIAAEFALHEGDKEVSLRLIKEATQYRVQTQPLGEPSSGCIFQNTPNTPQLKQLFPQFADRTHVSGGFLIDQAGLKGEREGAIEVSHIHAAFFVNKGGGTAADVKKLITKVKNGVQQQFGVELQEEVFYLG